MLTTIRQSTFETNSSSVHALVYVPNDVINAWQSRPTDWLDFGRLLDEVGATGPANVTVPVIARVDCFVDESKMYEKRDDDGYWVDDDEIIGVAEMLPLDLVEGDANKYRARYVNGQYGSFPIVVPDDGGVLVELDYEGWRD